MATNHHFGLVLDCTDPERLATFWAAALNYTRTGAAGSYVALHPIDGHGPKLLLQRVDERKTVKNRMHLDIDTRDIETESHRLEALGATRVQPATITEFGTTWILMTDPEGNEFCVCDGGHPGAD